MKVLELSEKGKCKHDLKTLKKSEKKANINIQSRLNRIKNNYDESLFKIFKQ